MKVFNSIVAVTLAQRTFQTEETQLGARRYNDLLKMVKNYNPDFDERKYWAYGCQCLILGDRPMSEMGHGKPIDQLDVSCHKYKQCQKCVRKEFGSECIGEFVKYSWGTRRREAYCEDAVGTCARALCECDLDFSKKLTPELVSVFDPEYHLFYTTTGWNPEESCEKGNGVSRPECCGPDDGPKYIYNSLSKQCCADYSIKKTCPAY
ncbi:Oidioi.mRNA.OKI2018_I69.chr1.g2050.t1.cds [Oikopleura dioica]|uniref:Oidioi.mRNA.OKI2018_I69.chr1.g2050.t1.cds n=1 Tax=Oikopleura dioica TaxID=34765 RepID=A0ABN7SV66_OIKDI|nr:Oidioi.mRNA.OKI2018_I69.chr1.g2050.t1.cds [Oikopleura dioica]